jgi:transposase
MTYFLKTTRPSKKGLYLQIYISEYVPGKGSRNRCYRSLGYVSDLKAKGIGDPAAEAKKEIDRLNAESRDVPQIGEEAARKHAGHFLLKSMFDKLGLDGDIDTMTSGRKADYRMSDFLRTLVYAQAVCPGSKLAAYEKVIPSLYGCPSFTYDQILDGVKYIGSDYQKYIECLNHHIGRNWRRNVSRTYFDCTNYYFEIDLEDGTRRKGPSKENRKEPIISQALMLDRDQIPIAMEMFPGNESEKPHLRRTVEDLKSRYDIPGKIVEVADKGLNCAKNIYYLHKEGKDGYIFSKSFRGKGLSDAEKEWVVLDTPQQNWRDVRDSEGKVLYRYKEKTETFSYRFTDDDGKQVSFTVKEKRIATYTPSLAAKQKAEISREVDKAAALTLKGLTRQEIGDSAKFLAVKGKQNGEDADVEVALDEEKVAEARRYAGYNLLVTSETGMSAREVYEAYHGLWRIEESFRVLKTWLEARPVFMQTEEGIYGHFLICYYALTILRLLELKTFRDGIPVGRLVSFIRDYSLTETKEKSYINNSTESSTYQAIKKELQILKLGNLYLTKKDVDSLFRTELP